MRSVRHWILLPVFGFSTLLFSSYALGEHPEACVPWEVLRGSGPPAASESVSGHVQGPSGEPLRVASLNMAREADVRRILTDWARAENFAGADVFLLQEVVEYADGNDETLVAELSRELGFHFVYAPAYRIDESKREGLAILSRYPLSDVNVTSLEYFPLRFKSRCRIALAATLERGGEPVRLVNIHLDTRINIRDRIAQLGPALEEASRFDGARIIGGDFNTADILWFQTMWPLPFLQSQSRGVREELESRGYYTPFIDGPPTLMALVLPLRLDWFFLRDIDTVAWGVENIRFSDHEGIWVQLDP